MLLLAQDAEGTGSMTDTQVRDEAVTIFLAGHETTANALTWTWYLLAQNPEVEARFHQELDQVLAGRPPAVEDYPSLVYTERVLAESMRLYPPAWAVGRMAKEDFSIAGYVAPKGSILLMAPYSVQRDPRFWPDPERFDPERWTPEEKERRPKLSYFPFGAGPRICIGERFAWMEGVLLLATIGQKWRMRHDPSHTVDLLPQITLRPRFGMRMRVEAR